MQSPNTTPSSPVVSICCITYNHERFIAQTLNGFLMQQTDFPIEILVHDDASTDSTASIVRDFVARYPSRIQAVLRTENQYQHGRSIMPMFADWAKGEFIALCEGDDFWTAPQKLQTQVAYLRANPDCVACCHDAVLVDEEGKTLASSYFHSTQEKFTQADVIGSVLSREPTCSLVFRRSAYLAPLPQWYLRRPNDLMLDILLTCHGSLGFINRNWAAYRVHSGGAWSGTTEASRVVELIVRYKLLLSDPYFLEHHRELLRRKVGEFESSLFTRTDGAKEVARLESVVAEQRAAMAANQDECQRLSSLVEQYSGDIAHLSSTAKTQTTLIAVLEKERDRLAALVAQYSGDIAHLSSTAKTQTDHIAVLEKERDRLAALVTQYSGDIAHLSATAKTQTDHIAVLDKERDRLAARETLLTGETAHYLKVMDEQLRYIKILEAERSQEPSTKS